MLPLHFLEINLQNKLFMRDAMYISAVLAVGRWLSVRLSHQTSVLHPNGEKKTSSNFSLGLIAHHSSFPRPSSVTLGELPQSRRSNTRGGKNCNF